MLSADVVDVDVARHRAGERSCYPFDALDRPGHFFSKCYQILGIHFADYVIGSSHLVGALDTGGLAKRLGDLVDRTDFSLDEDKRVDQSWLSVG